MSRFQFANKGLPTMTEIANEEELSQALLDCHQLMNHIALLRNKCRMSDSKVRLTYKKRMGNKAKELLPCNEYLTTMDDLSDVRLSIKNRIKDIKNMVKFMVDKEGYKLFLAKSDLDKDIMLRQNEKIKYFGINKHTSNGKYSVNDEHNYQADYRKYVKIYNNSNKYFN
jgi:hypothetical protein